jgi:SAM-dependent MidA family methyltransferase
VIDYGHDARELYSATHSAGTLTTFARHTAAGPTETTARSPDWLRNPGEQDLTTHVDFTSLRAAAEAEGLTTLGFLDQTYFLLGLVAARDASQNPENPENLANSANLKENLALRTLLMPGGLGSTHKVLILGKKVGTPLLAGCSFKMRVT